MLLMAPDDMKARKAAARALYVSHFTDEWGATAPEIAAECEQAVNAAIDAYLAALSPVSDEQLDEIEKRASEHEKRYPWRYQEAAKDFLAIDRKRLLAEVRRLRALSSHPDEALRAVYNAGLDRAAQIAREQADGALLMRDGSDYPVWMRYQGAYDGAVDIADAIEAERGQQ